MRDHEKYQKETIISPNRFSECDEACDNISDRDDQSEVYTIDDSENESGSEDNEQASAEANIRMKREPDKPRKAIT